MKINKFFKEVKGEFKHIVWPSRKETTWFTIGVSVIALLIAYYIGLLDIVFTGILESII